MIAAVVVVAIGILAVVFLKGTSSGPTVGDKDTLPAAMRNAYGGGPGGPSAAPPQGNQ